MENYAERHKPHLDVKVIKKDGTRESFNVQKVIDAVGKSAYRALTEFTDMEKDYICENVIQRVDELIPAGLNLLCCHKEFLIQFFIKLIEYQAPFRGNERTVRIRTMYMICRPEEIR